ncbi:MAG TPA: hypothetical protein VJ233_09755 [Hyphomicrobiaceae bacterium]|nr:hypothetical protein [Hyphomicrobiaceae bacterium]
MTYQTLTQPAEVARFAMPWRLILSMVFLVGSVAPSPAQTGPPSGWKANLFNGGVVLTSPPDAAGRQVNYIQFTAERGSGEARSRFTSKVMELRRRLGGPALPATGVREETWTAPDGRRLSSFSDGFWTTEKDTNAKITIVSFGYRVGNDDQMFTVLHPSEMSDREEPLSIAIDNMASHWKQSALVRPRGGARPTVDRPDTTQAPQPTAPSAKREEKCTMKNLQTGAYQKPSQNCTYVGTQRQCYTRYESVPIYTYMRVCS